MCGGKIELDPFAPLRGREQAALCMKSSDVRRLQEFFFPQRVGAGERGVTAQSHLDGGREPAQRPAVGTWKQKRRLGEIHLRADTLHPRRVAFAIQQTDRGWIAAERLIGERVDLKKSHSG